ncbi:hypothetical protein [Erythrobacter sp. F6033]|uniref:hypothetical protein n=1 Tax=Erythrobacter sp. F6033 TaxID=2926401 RepID=UPI001FF4A032|nr:hypothetical protein [Erythrobacter sp. F6033]MCK0129206.1 hypothetical protein [Erythrobacter sp. F6033]
MTYRPLFALAPLALLAACGDPEPAGETATEQGGAATGEVLGGSISDDMIPLDQLTSTSPPAEPTASSDGDSSSRTSAPAAEQEPDAESQEAEPASADPAPPVAAPLEE